MQTTVFNVSGITDSNAASNVKDALIDMPGVSSVFVDVDTSNVTITYDSSTVDLSAIRSALAKNGFYMQ